MLSDVLKKAKSLIAKGWCQCAMATDYEGNPVSVNSPEACNWCIMGAVLAASENPVAVQQALDTLKSANSIRSLSVWNDRDERTQEEVLKLFDNTIWRV